MKKISICLLICLIITIFTGCQSNRKVVEEIVDAPIIDTSYVPARIGHPESYRVTLELYGEYRTFTDEHLYFKHKQNPDDTVKVKVQYCATDGVKDSGIIWYTTLRDEEQNNGQ